MVETGDGASHTIGFGKTGGLPKAVFGKVEEAAATDDNFPHAVIAVNNDTAATGDTAAFTVKGDDLFKNTWEKLVKRQDCLAKLSWPIRLALYIFLVLSAFYGYLSLIFRLTGVYWWMYFAFVLAVGEVSTAFIAVDFLWVDGVDAASRGLTETQRFWVWALFLAKCITLGAMVGLVLVSAIISLCPFLVTDVLLAYCRTPTSGLPFYRWLGLRAIKVPTLTLTVRPSDEAVDQS